MVKCKLIKSMLIWLYCLKLHATQSLTTMEFSALPEWRLTVTPVLARGCQRLKKRWGLVFYILLHNVAGQLLSCVWLFATPWTAARQASLSITVSWSLLRFMSIELMMPSNHLILCHPLLFLNNNFITFTITSEIHVHIKMPIRVKAAFFHKDIHSLWPAFNLHYV